MDSLTHLLVGVCVGIGASRITNNNELVSVGVATLSSFIPDADTIMKFFGERRYLNTHRRTTHQVHIAIILAIISPLIFFNMTQNDFLFYYLLSLSAVILHLFLDLLNPYGTKFIPFFRRIKLNILSTIDPIILLFLVVNIVMLHYYYYYNLLLIPIYILLRLLIHTLIKKKLYNKNKVKKVYLLATYNPFKWHVILDFYDHFLVADYYNKLINTHLIIKNYIPLHLQDLICKTKDYKAFSALAYVYTSFIKEVDDKIIITFIDLKYRKKDSYYFKLIFEIIDNEITYCYLGFTISNGYKLKLD